MNIAEIKRCACADGPGIRVAVYVSGCRRGCKNCHNPEAQSFTYGRPWTQTDEDEVIRLCQSKSLHGLSILGGEPLSRLSDNRKAVIAFCKEVKERFPDKDIWMWSGYTFQELLSDDTTKEVFDYIDYLVDGPYIEEMRDLSLKFRGSANQRIIRLHPKVEDVTDAI